MDQFSYTSANSDFTVQQYLEIAIYLIYIAITFIFVQGVPEKASDF